jgi:hypothetical protein
MVPPELLPELPASAPGGTPPSDLPPSIPGKTPPSPPLAFMHVFVAVSQLPPWHAAWLVAVHCTQAPWGEQALPCEFPAHCVSVSQAPHVSAPPTVLQMGVGLLHSELSRHDTHVCDVVLQAPPVQSLFCKHPTQVPAVTSQTCAVPVAHSLLDAHPRHVWLVVSQMGVLPAQSMLPRQPTHVFVAGSQTPVEQSEPVAHPTQRPVWAPVVSQTGVGAEQSPA